MKNQRTEHVEDLEKKVKALEQEKAIVIAKLDQWMDLYKEQAIHCNSIKTKADFWHGKASGIGLAKRILEGGDPE